MDFFSSGFFGSDPSQIASPSSSSSGGGSSSQTDWLNTIYKFAALGTQTYLAQDAINSARPAILYGPNGPIAAGGGGGVIAAGGVNSILGTSSIWLFLFVAVLLLLLLKR